MYSVQEICEEQERQYNQLMEEDDQYCHPESFKWGFEHGVDYALTKAGWHPASELPKEGEEVMVVQTGSITAYRAVFIDGVYYSVIIGKKVYYPSVKWWCYPPMEK